MSMVLIFKKEIVKVIYAYGTQSGRKTTEKQQFYDKLACERNLRSNAEVVLG